MRFALKYGKIKQCISDRGSQFMNNMEGYSEFQEFLKSIQIHHIKTRIKHPQSNGKVEKWFECYDKHRKAFTTHDNIGYIQRFINLLALNTISVVLKRM